MIDVMSGPAPTSKRPGGRAGELVTDGLQLIICTVAVVIASVAYGPFFADFGYLPTVAGAAVLGTLCGTGVVRRRRPPGLAWVLSMIVFTLYAVYLVFPQATSSGWPGLPALAAVGDGLLNGLARMLTVTPPADMQGDLLILPVVVAFAAAFVSAVTCAGRSVLLPMLPPLLVFVSALLLSANAAEFRWGTTLAFLGCALALILLRTNQVGGGGYPGRSADSGGSAWRAAAGPLLLGVPVIVGVTLLAVTAAGALPIGDGSTRFDPRAARPIPLTIQAQLNTLVGVREQLLLPTPADVFTIHADGGQIPIDRVRTAALDSYDGVQWVSTARFVRTGSTLPTGPDLTDPTRLTMDVTLTAALPAPFLPEFGRPVSIQATGVGFDPATGLLATDSPTLSSYRYRLTGDYAAATPDPAAVPDPQPAGDRSMTDLPDLPGDPAAALRTLAQQWTAGQSSPYAQLTAIADRMRQLSYALDATPGHSYAALDRFVDTTDPGVDRRVTEEQTAAAFTVMARTLGYPARVAVGYRLNPQRAVDGTLTVTTQDADAWAEVAFTGHGWVPFQVTPPRQGDPPPPPVTPQGNDQVTITPAPPTGPGPAAATATTTMGRAISWAIALAVLLPLLLLIAAVGAVAAIKQWRRNRRSRTGSTADRITGAWRESTDRLLEHGMRVTPSHTPTDIGLHTIERFGDDAGKQVTTLAPILSHALYARDEPDEAAVARAWHLESELHAILDSRRPWWAGALYWIDPRPLWHRKHPRSGRTPQPAPLSPPGVPVPTSATSRRGSGGPANPQHDGPGAGRHPTTDRR
jgi:transglutaminase-like putative cysteine protease